MTACDPVTAVNGKPGNIPGANDEVVIEPGSYTLTATLTPPLGTSLKIHGVLGKPRPALTKSVSYAFNGSAAELRWLDFETTGAPAVGFSGPGTAEQIVARAKSSTGQPVCQCYGGTLRDSIAVALPGSTGVAAGVQSNGGTSSVTYRNDTFYVSDAGATALKAVQEQVAGPAVTITAINVIARNSAGGTDVAATGSNASVTMSSSDYTTSAGAVTSGGGNISSAPVFENAGAGDFRQTLASPTIDNGVNDPLNGPSDFEGDARTINGTTDIGADEFAPIPAGVTGSATNLSTSAATVHGTVNANGASTTYHFEYGASTTYGHSTASGTLGPTTTAHQVTRVIGGLLPSHTYHYRLVASNSAGIRFGGDRTFKTAKSHFSGGFVTRGSARVKNGVARVKVGCPNNAGAPAGGGARKCTGTLTLRTAKKLQTPSGKKKIKIGSATFVIAAGKRRTVSVPISARGQALLAAKGKLKSKATVVSRDSAGTKRKRSRALLLELTA